MTVCQGRHLDLCLVWLMFCLLLLACLVLLLSVKKSCESKVVISCFFTCLLVPVCVCLYVCIMCVLPGVVAIKIQFNSMCVTWCCLYVCLQSKQTYKQHQGTHIGLRMATYGSPVTAGVFKVQSSSLSPSVSTVLQYRTKGTKQKTNAYKAYRSYSNCACAYLLL